MNDDAKMEAAWGAFDARRGVELEDAFKAGWRAARENAGRCPNVDAAGTAVQYCQLPAGHSGICCWGLA